MALSSSIANRTQIKSTSDDFGQKEQDANTALLNLDKGLRSTNIGDQCEAIVRFPVLFEKYPFPILINSAFMRLADAYRGGNNFIRLCILKVVQESCKHLEKILNVEDLSKRIYSVIHSNDPLARAITLRCLGSLATIVSEQMSIHHTITVALDSHDAVEVEAAIFAADNFARYSRSFCESICEKLGTMIERLSTPLDIKIKIIPILRHMHRNIYTAQKAREVCQGLLESYPSDKFGQLTLHTMSVLSVEAVVHAQQQLEVLMGYIEQSSSQSLTLVAIRDLCLITKRVPHLWTSPHTTRLCTFLSTTISIQSVDAVLDVLTTLSCSLAVKHLCFNSTSPNYEVLRGLCYHDSRLIASKAILLLSQLAVHQHSEDDSRILDDIFMALHSALITETGSSSQNTASLKKCLRSVVLLYTQLPQLDIFLLEIIIDLLKSFKDNKRVVVGESLAAIGHHKSELVEAFLPKVLDLIRATIDQNFLDHSLVYLCTVILQVAQTRAMPVHVRDLLIGCSQSCDPWLSWKVARQAMRYCQFSLADSIIVNLRKKVYTEQFYFWLSGLHHICEGESELAATDNSNAVESSRRALHSYQCAISALKAACSHTSPLDFQTHYTQLRSQLLCLHGQLLMSCNTFRKCPPPAVAAALATTQHQDLSRSGQVVKQLMTCANEYEAMERSVRELSETSFDADHVSLRNINVLRETCRLMRSCIMAVVHNKPVVCDTTKGSDDEMTDRSTTRLRQITRTVAEEVASITDSSLTHQHIEALTRATVSLMRASHPFPRYFFQKLQSTTITLAISPKSGEPINTNCSSQLTLKVEGVIQYGPRPGLYRRVCQVKIYVDSEITRKVPEFEQTKQEANTHNSLVQTTEPHNDYFATNFLLSFPVAGKHSVRVTVSVVDENQSEWKTGPRTEFFVKSVDDSPQTR